MSESEKSYFKKFYAGCKMLRLKKEIKIFQLASFGSNEPVRVSRYPISTVHLGLVIFKHHRARIFFGVVTRVLKRTVRSFR